MEQVSRYDVADALRAAIERGVWKPGEQVPSTREVAAMFRISPKTASEALGILVRDRVLTSINGRGRYVRDPEVDGAAHPNG